MLNVILQRPKKGFKERSCNYQSCRKTIVSNILIYFVFLKLLIVFNSLFSCEAFIRKELILQRIGNSLHKKQNIRGKETLAKIEESLEIAAIQRVSTPPRQTIIPMLDLINEKSRRTFEGKNILITGASSGLGFSLSRALTACSPTTLILSSRRESALLEVVEVCKAVNPNVTFHVVTCDLEDPESVDKLSAEALAHCPSGIDVLVNNGGVSSRSTFLETKAEIDRQIMQINFFSGAALAKAFVPGMVKKGSGRIIWISSVQGLFALPSRSSYAASKFAVQGYCESLRAELTASGVLVHTVSPGYIRTNLSRSALTGDGKPSGKLDATTAAGADPDELSIEIINKVANGYLDFAVAANLSAIAAVYIRVLCPALFRYVMLKRHKKSQLAIEKDKED